MGQERQETPNPVSGQTGMRRKLAIEMFGTVGISVQMIRIGISFGLNLKTNLLQREEVTGPRAFEEEDDIWSIREYGRWYSCRH